MSQKLNSLKGGYYSKLSGSNTGVRRGILGVWTTAHMAFLGA